MAYEDQSVYNKFQNQSHSSSGCGCDDGCSGSSSKCSCCPPGLVGVYNSDGVHIGCLTPADAEEYNTNNKSCKEGYIALYNNTTQEFLGCVSEAEYVTIYEAVNPPTP